MGILDEAIRAHLELKRRSGAADSELKRMEDEAFGPPSRPGEPDFPESEEMAVHGGNGVAAETPVGEARGTSEAPVAPPPEAPPEPVEPEEGEEEPPAEPAPAEPTQEETGSAPPPEPASESDEHTAIYDQNADRGPQSEELDLDLEERGPSPAEGEAQGGASEAPSEAPIESLDTVEHPFPDEEVAEPESSQREGEPAREEPGEAQQAVEGTEAPGEEEWEAEDAGEGSGDDVLADTPDFLKDAPEDDELWFEQGQPKDFDF